MYVCSSLQSFSPFVHCNAPHPTQVIPRKDLPRIYTMCLPVKDRDGGTANPAESEGELSLSSGLHDLEVRV